MAWSLEKKASTGGRLKSGVRSKVAPRFTTPSIIALLPPLVQQSSPLVCVNTTPAGPRFAGALVRRSRANPPAPRTRPALASAVRTAGHDFGERRRGIRRGCWRSRHVGQRAGAGPLFAHREHQPDHEKSVTRERQDREGREGDGAGVCVRVHKLHNQRVRAPWERAAIVRSPLCADFSIWHFCWC